MITVHKEMVQGSDDWAAARCGLLTASEMKLIITPTLKAASNDKWGFTIGYSPDGLVGENGQVECKSRSQKYQIQTLTEFVPNEAIDPDFMIQVQTGLMVSERDWTDLVSYCGGLPMATVRVFPDAKVQEAILNAATGFETRLSDKLATYNAILKSKARLINTERKIYQEMF